MGFHGFGSVQPHNWRNYIYGRSPAFYILAVIVIALLIYAITRIPDKTTTFRASPRESAWAACTQSVEKQIGLAASEAETFRPIKVTLMADDGYQVDVHYAKTNAAYRCTVKESPEGNWQVLSLTVK